MHALDTGVLPPVLLPRHRMAAVAFALPWGDNQALALGGIGLWLAAALLVVALLAFALAMLLQARTRRLKSLEEAMRAQRQFHHAVLDALPLAVRLLRPDGTPLLSNAHGDALKDDAIAKVFDAEREAVLGGQPRRIEVDYTAEHKRHPAYLWLQAIGDGTQPLGMAGAMLDIAEFRATERALRDMAESLPIAVLSLRFEGERGFLTFAVGQFGRLFNLARQDLADADDCLAVPAWRERIHPEDAQAFAQLLAMGEDGARALDFRAFGQNGLRWIHASLVASRDDDGQRRLMGYFIDTTEINLRNESLRIARDVAERASKAKADFLATMSHEIRTPMNGLIGMLELLDHTPVNPEQRELLHAVQDSSASLLQILNDILDFSKLEAGDLRLDEAPFDPRVWLDGAVRGMVAAAGRKGLALHVQVDAGVAGRVHGDALRLRQVVLNLIGNAIKFTDRGSVSVHLEWRGDAGAQQDLRLSVADTGIGIAKDKQAGLFQPFTQAELSTSRRYGGTGLGLAICRRLVELMGGGIVLSSQVDAGTRVSVDLRLPVAARAVDVPAALHGRHAIVRLADVALAATLSGYLQAMGMTVESVMPHEPLRQGMAASLLFIAHDDGSSATQVHAHIVAVSPETLPPSGVQWRDGRVVLSSHPLLWQATLRACLGALELDGTAVAQPTPASSTPVAPQATPAARALPARAHLLVAEDHPVSQQLIQRQLTLLGLSCDVVDNGRDAYEALCGGGYDLLLTDANMPLMSGYELATAWREHERQTGTEALPIVAMTANAMSGERERALAAGMSDLLNKPLQLSALSQKLAQWLPADRSGTEQPHRMSAALYADLQPLFAEAGQVDLERLDQAIDERDAMAASHTLHRLIGAMQLFEDGPLLERGRHLLEQLQDTGPQAFASLAAYRVDVGIMLMKMNMPPRKS